MRYASCAQCDWLICFAATQNWTLPQVYSCLDHTPSRANCHCAAAAADGMCADKASWQSSTDSKVTAPAVTKLDKAFEAEGCQFVWGMNDLTVSDLNALFQKVLLHSAQTTSCMYEYQSQIVSHSLNLHQTS